MSMENFDNKYIAWNVVFYCTITFLLIALIIFLLFASASPQPWAESKFVTIEEFKKNNNLKSIQSSA